MRDEGMKGIYDLPPEGARPRFAICDLRFTIYDCRMRDCKMRDQLINILPSAF